MIAVTMTPARKLRRDLFLSSPITTSRGAVMALRDIAGTSGPDEEEDA
jgi:hypothetical protein